MTINTITATISSAYLGTGGQPGPRGPAGQDGATGIDNWSELYDTNFTGLTGSDIARFDGTNWVNVPLSINLFDFSSLPVYATIGGATGALPEDSLYVLTGDDTIRIVT